MKIKIITGLLFLVIFLPLCKKETPTEPVVPMTVHIQGVVTDAITNKPISNFYLGLRYGGGCGGDISLRLIPIKRGVILLHINLKKVAAIPFILFGQITRDIGLRLLTLYLAQKNFK